MADVNLDSQFNWGSVRTGMEQMRAFAGQTTRGISSDITGMFAGAISVAAVVGAFNKVLEKAEEIHRESARFGIDAEQLQLIGNAAKENGISLETTAAAMNKLLLATSAAVNGNAKMVAAFHELNINVNEFAQLNAQEKFLALSDAVKTAGLTTETYAAVAKILGQRFGTELIPTMLQGSQAIRETGQAMGILSNQTVESLDVMGDSFDRIKNQMTVGIGNAMVFMVHAFQQGIAGITGIVVAAKEALVADFKIIERALHFDWKGVADAARNGMQNVKAAIDGALLAMEEIRNPPKAAAAPFAPAIAGAEELKSTIGEASNAMTALGASSDKAENKIRSNLLQTMSSTEKLNLLLNERVQLEEKLATLPGDGKLSTLDKEVALTEQIREKDSEILVIRQQIAEEAEKEYQANLKSLNAIDEKIVKSQNEVLIQNLILAGKENEARALEIALDYEEKIQKVLNDANEARRQGNEIIAQANERLAEQLEIQKQNALAAERKLAADKASAAAATQIRDAAGALLNYNLRLGNFAPSINVPGTLPGGGIELTGEALRIMNLIQSLSAQMSLPNQTPAMEQALANQILALIPYLQQQMQILISINKNLTPVAGRS